MLKVFNLFSRRCATVFLAIVGPGSNAPGCSDQINIPSHYSTLGLALKSSFQRNESHKPVNIQCSTAQWFNCLSFSFENHRTIEQLNTPDTQ
jgi:hypothetical protein